MVIADCAVQCSMIVVMPASVTDFPMFISKWLVHMFGHRSLQAQNNPTYVYPSSNTSTSVQFTSFWKLIEENI